MKPVLFGFFAFSLIVLASASGCGDSEKAAKDNTPNPDLMKDQKENPTPPKRTGPPKSAPGGEGK